jgi:hypothetical protein
LYYQPTQLEICQEKTDELDDLIKILNAKFPLLEQALKSSQQAHSPLPLLTELRAILEKLF